MGTVSGQQPVPAIDLVIVIACDDEERDALADVGGPLSELLKPKPTVVCGRIVPHQAISFVRHDERHAHGLACRRVVIVRARSAWPRRSRKPCWFWPSP